jgi:hypothetical protein
MKESKIKTWWKRTSTGTKVISSLPLVIIIPFFVIGFVSESGFPAVGWVVGSLISTGIVALAMWSNVTDYMRKAK